jgi:hypothetical protein
MRLGKKERKIACLKEQRLPMRAIFARARKREQSNKKRNSQRDGFIVSILSQFCLLFCSAVVVFSSLSPSFHHYSRLVSDLIFINIFKWA